MKKGIFLAFLSIILADRANASMASSRLSQRNQNVQYHDVFTAAYHHDMKAVDAFFKNGVSITDTDEDGWTILHYAVRNGEKVNSLSPWQVLQYLVARGADYTATDNDGFSVLHAAAMGGDQDVVSSIINMYRQDPNSTDDNGFSVLHAAAQNGKENIVRFLVEDKNVDVNASSYSDYTVLHAAAKSGNLSLFNYLIQKGAKPDASNIHGLTVFKVYEFNTNETEEASRTGTMNILHWG